MPTGLDWFTGNPVAFLQRKGVSSWTESKWEAHQVTVCVCPTCQVVPAVGLVIGGSTTSLDTRGNAETKNSKGVKRRTYRTNMIISLDEWRSRERGNSQVKQRASPEQEVDGCRYIGKPCEHETVSGHICLSLAFSEYVLQLSVASSHVVTVILDVCQSPVRHQEACIIGLTHMIVLSLIQA